MTRVETTSATRIGVIADTHGLLRPEAEEALRGVELILHAGDIGKPEILEHLAGIAPVIAVRGNNDTAAWAESIPEEVTLEAGSCRIFMLHDRKRLDPQAAGYDVIIAGHSHKPLNEARDGVLHLNPGSAGPRRFRLPVCVARLDVAEKPKAEIISLIE